jgi:hypothetical protein
MPKVPTGIVFGDLHVQYQVDMPRWQRRLCSGGEKRAELGRLLDKLDGSRTKQEEPPPKQEVHILQQASLADFGRASGRPPRQFYS